MSKQTQQTPGVALITQIQQMLGHGALGFSPRSKTIKGWHRNHNAACKKVKSWSDAFCVWTKVVHEGSLWVRHTTGSGRTTFLVSDTSALVIVTAGSGEESGCVVGVAQIVHNGEEWQSQIWLHDSAAQRPDRFNELFNIAMVGEILIGEHQIPQLKEVYLSSRRQEEWWLGQVNNYYFWDSCRRGTITSFEKAMRKMVPAPASEEEEEFPSKFHWHEVESLMQIEQQSSSGRAGKRTPRA